jgi:L-threonylcarbamoyladenylate synthase
VTIERAVEAIQAGEVIGFPTDTVYGIGADPLNEEAVARLFELKGRPEHKPIGLLLASVEQAGELGDISRNAEALAARYWPGALTLVVTPKVILADWVGGAQRRSVGLRVPDHPVAIEILSRVGPLAVTSANLTGGNESMSDADARAVFGDLVAVYVEGRATGGESSTVVDATGDGLVVLRQGPVRV